MVLNIKHLKYSYRSENENLIEAIIQNYKTGEVVSLFYMNEDAVKKSLETGYVYRYSRKKRKVVMKGEESGNRMKIMEMIADCDYDSLLVKVIPEGPACHLGKESCFDVQIK